MILAILQSSAIVLAALTAVVVFRRGSAAVRHLILAAGLVGALLAPAFSLVLPSWHVTRKFQVRPVNSLFSSVTVIGKKGIHRSDLEFPAVSETPLRNTVTAGDIAIRIWLFGSAIGAVFLVAGLGRIALLAFRAQPARSISNLRRPVLLLQSNAALLGTFGILRPRIILPRNSATWSEERLHVVLTHELAHIKRFDWPVQMLAEIARTIYWFNPLFWIVCRRLRIESEHACDDVVLNTGIDARDYAAHLLELARTLKNPGRRWSPVLAMAQPPHLERRFIAMLNPTLNHRPATRTSIVVAFGVTLALTMPLAAMRAPKPNVVVMAQAPAISTPPIAAAKPEPARRTVLPTAAIARVQAPPNGSLFGTISDATGARVPGVEVTLLTVGETPVQTAMSGDAGDFLFPIVPVGRYSLKAELRGFVTYRKTPVEIRADRPIRENIALTVSSVTTAVFVSAAAPRQLALPIPSSGRIRVGGYVVAPTLISQVKPVYPPEARIASIQGTVHVQAIIGKDGSLLNVHVISSSDPQLTNAALESVRQWRYQPAKLNGEPIEVATDIDVEFNLVQ